MPSGAGRFAPTPSGDLHLGNLRTALLAWLFARSTGRSFLLRMEDLDRVRRGAAQRQLDDLSAIGVTWDDEVAWQSGRKPLYAKTVERLRDNALVYECYCSRKEIQQAVTAPHAPQGAYPGTCRNLTDAERAERRSRADRPPALRLLTQTTTFTIDDEVHGSYTGLVDDFVVQRGDGTPAYNLAVVVDDATQGVDQVVRGDDLLPSTPRQAYLASLLGLPVPRYAHVPLAVNSRGQRLAKRDGAVTLHDQLRLGRSPAQVRGLIASSLRLAPAGSSPTVEELLARFDPRALPRDPWVVQT
ncbi:tRNA glutamyl-Q(34) synthetase GluQRS [Skermania sp. ID1734]|uniref:tRNA glutamyl-Q(34) synthetase GluQRS n=1 Tax=Skermania sp. ID1734 TaxID=2597516 RepID=UPI00117CDC1F|nr:tRNA glutamyl-Q(34) synthetase GluQRS [Skermania sp. ID1734]TSE00653.1 tRNA glutamyl-Q(34) synthetase GluQRS [Skermania sp. ID1734]